MALTETEIFVPEHWGGKDDKIQYKTHIPYAKIRNIFMIVSDKNSLGKIARWVFTPMPYIVFNCNQGEQKAINVFYYIKNKINLLN